MTMTTITNFDGATFTWSFKYPDVNSFYTGPVQITGGPAIEVPYAYAFNDGLGSWDFSGSTITLHLGFASYGTSAVFNGFHIYDSGDVLPDFSGFSILTDTATTAGPFILTFDASNLYINWADIPWNPGDIVMSVQFGGAPPPRPNTSPTITSDGGGDTASVHVDENTTLVSTLTADDPDQGNTQTFSLTGNGDDAALFEILNGNELHFKVAPDYENLPDDLGDVGYQVEIQVSDGAGGIDTQMITVTVDNVTGVILFGGGRGGSMMGTNEEDQLTGSARNERINGLDGDDSIDGSGGRDTMAGGNGDDTYYADRHDDMIIETGTGGHDTVIVSSTNYYVLGANVEDLIYTGSGNFFAYGNALDNRIVGGSGNDQIRGGAGADSLDGGDGNDLLFIDSDDVIVQGGNGFDTVFVLGGGGVNLNLVPGIISR